MFWSEIESGFGELGGTSPPRISRSPPVSGLLNMPCRLTSHLYFQRSILGFPGIPGSNDIPGVLGVPGPHGPQGREGVKGQIGDKGSQGMPGPRGDRGREGPPGKSEPQGFKGMYLERGIAGNQGRKGDKGEKGESTKASQPSVVPQTNWKQCVWKSESGTDNGKIKVIRISIIKHFKRK